LLCKTWLLQVTRGENGLNVQGVKSDAGLYAVAVVNLRLFANNKMKLVYEISAPCLYILLKYCYMLESGRDASMETLE
jgi:hypothetical protein